jgi:hypothetical protein
VNSVEYLQAKVGDNIIEYEGVGDVWWVHFEVLQCPVEPIFDDGAVGSALNLPDVIAPRVNRVYGIHGLQVTCCCERV